MADPLKASDGSLFIQEQPGSAPVYVGCADVAALPDPRGAVTLLYCRDKDGKLQPVGETQAPPDVPSTTVTAWVYPDADVLDRVSDRDCRANVFLMLRNCGRAGVFNNWVRTSVLTQARLVNVTVENAVMREATDPTTRALEFAGRDVLQLRNSVSFGRQTVAETTALNAIAMDNQVVCAGNCGAQQDACDVGYAVGDAPSGSPTSRADVWQTSNAGSTWTNTTGGNAHPFVAGQDIKAAALFTMTATTKRWLVAREATGGEALKVAYSDNNGATWTLVTVGSVTAEGVVGAKGLFVLDRDNIWLVTTSGNVYYSSDAGASWSLQSAAATASGGLQLNAVQFIDEDNGYAVGNTATIIRTTDGGVTWNAVDEPSGVTANFTALAVFTKFRIAVGSAADGVYQTHNAGTTWSSKTFDGQGTTGTIKALVPVNELVVWMVHSPTSGQHYVHRSIDGGHSFERLTTPTNSGINDLVACNSNSAYVVGPAQGGTAFIGKISA